MNITIYPDAHAMSHPAARHVVQVASEAIATHGRFMFALTGGSAAKILYGLLTEEPYRSQINWSLVEFFWGDERNVSPDDPESNYHLAWETMLSKLPIPEKNIHRMRGEESDREAASRAYEQELRQAFSTNGVPGFDLIHLGMGPEGHIASLFPHQASLKETQRLVLAVTVPKPPPPRLTLTPPVLNAARHVLFMVTNVDKADAVHAVIDGAYNPDEYPAQIVRPPQGEIAWMLDEAAASKLQKRS
jgi:6-phosphogluconolactonase